MGVRASELLIDAGCAPEGGMLDIEALESGGALWWGGLTDAACTGWCGLGVSPTKVAPPGGGTEGLANTAGAEEGATL
jgi:hypothetical protein